MINKILVILLVSIGLGSLTAQTFIGRLTPVPESVPARAVSTDTLHILGVMVEFQTDKDAATDGNGKFGSIYSQNYGNTILDPLPHDQAYFNAHLEFVKNYFKQVSNGKLTIDYHVLPNVITVSGRMRDYSPAINSTDFTPLADFSKEVWAKADSAYPGFDFAKYNLFTIFHAGVGRDVSLPGSIPDSRDLPSIYLNSKALGTIFGAGFNGFPVSGGSFNIDNSLIMPETESREQTLIDGSSVLYQITINGLLASSVGSYLGLPDLFDTKTGVSAIGRFGLMDGQAIFAYNGVFPPEPSAWEKIFLGWATPATLAPGNYNVSLVTQMAAAASDTVILKLPINSSEYFLVENRQRDALHNGAVITYVDGGDTLTDVFPKDQDGFYNYAVDSLKGVIINVDEYDWALPGVIDDTSDYHGGILVWHIDNNIINAKIAEDQINADKNHRGVNLMEASGVPEIGERFTTLLGDQIIGEGSYEDYWYSGNPATLYQNKFAADTRPSSNANSGASSLITLSDFSASSNRMSFKITYGDSLVKPIFSTKPALPAAAQSLNSGGTDEGFNIVSNSNLYRTDAQGKVTNTINGFSAFKTASALSGGVQYTAGAADSTLNIFTDNGSANTLVSVNAGDIITAPPVIEAADGQPLSVLIGTKGGNLKTYTLGSPGSIPVLKSADLISNYQIARISTGGGKISVLSESADKSHYSVSVVGENNSASGDGSVYDYAMSTDRNGSSVEIVLLPGNHFRVFGNGKTVSDFTVSSQGDVTSFALADLKQDGNIYIIFANGTQIDAVNLQGSEAENFPFRDPSGYGFVSTPVTADFTGDSRSEVIAVTGDGRIFAIDGGTGKAAAGFPISGGAGLTAAPVLFVNNGKLSLAEIDAQDGFSAWHIGADAGKVYWAEGYGSSGNSAYTGQAVSQNNTNQFFPADKAFNYPNPVYGGKTYIHYYVSEDSKIDIKIFDLAGDFVAELSDNAQGGMSKETAWDVSNIQSGVYFARIEAVSSSGKTESNIIKIAVIK